MELISPRYKFDNGAGIMRLVKQDMVQKDERPFRAVVWS